MAKPSDLNLIFADTGSKIDPTDLVAAAGYDVEIFPYQQWNFMLNQTSWILSNINANGIVEWDVATPYVVGARVIYNGVRYSCKTGTTGSLPTDTTFWLVDDGKAIGAMSMAEGSGWVDNVTKPGWYACVTANAIHGVPNLVGQFVKGGSSSGAFGGLNGFSLNPNNLPPHLHVIDVPDAIAAEIHEHTYPHVYQLQGIYNSVTNWATVVTMPDTGWSDYVSNGQPAVYVWNGVKLTNAYATTLESAAHSHIFNGTTDSFGLGAATAFVPAHYKTIFIRKCY